MRASLLLPVLVLTPALAFAQRGGGGGDAPAGPPPTIAAKTAATKHMPGFLPLDWDAVAGKLYLEIPHLNTDLLYTDSLPWGMGSNDVGLDRGQTGSDRTKVVFNGRPLGSQLVPEA